MKEKSVENKIPMLAVLVMGAAIISFSGVWVKWSHVPSTTSAFYRVFFGGIFLVAASIYRREWCWPGRRQLLLMVLCSFFFSLDLWLYHYSINRIGPGLGTILPNFQVFILTAIGIVFLKETIPIQFILSVPLAFAGLLMVVGVDWDNLNQTYRLGILAGLAAAVCYSGFLLSLRRLQAEQSGISFFYVLTLVSLISTVFLGSQVYVSSESFRIPGLMSLASLIALGLFSQFLGWIFIANTLPKIRASLSGLVLLLQPALAFVWDVLIFSRPMGWINWCGVGIVLMAIYLGTVRSVEN